MSFETWLRFWSKVNKNGPVPTHRPDLGPCWLWTAGKSGGYGHFAETHSLPVRAHRFSYEMCVGKIPEGLQPDHLCRVRPCVRPDHMELVTGKENTLRGIGPTALNATKVYCSKGHLLPDERIQTADHIQRICLKCRGIYNAARKQEYAQQHPRKICCPKGHPYSGQINTGGHVQRICKTCRGLASKAYYRRLHGVQ